MNDDFVIESASDSQQIMQWLDDRLYEHNSAKLNRNDGALFSKLVKDENKNIVAGIAGWTWAGACEVTHLWVNEHLRQNDIGKKLLEAAEAEAKNKSCRVIMIRSYGFQAPHFYKKNGYTISSVLRDFPPGHSYYVLTKRLTPPLL